ncbi:HsdS protein [Paenibacillus algicola]|uniref:HsdS protein n=1 Tax=Paenibacillus algicola TaxID=2565926 RepID=A0A4P8XNA4_9BACL|nr:restriction endonuclease subunit S [Paenibacillus algicola]QCT04357.1 HsdS protein [Paenibacillus algicola]
MIFDVKEEVTLDEIAEFQKGFAFKSADFQNAGVKVVKVSNLTWDSIDVNSCICIDASKAGQYSRYELLSNDIVITTVGSWPNNPASVVGKVIKVPAELSHSLLNQNAVRVRAKKGTNRQYLYYLLKSVFFKDYIIGTAQGSANQASITQNDIKAFKYLVPSIAKQENIGNSLKVLDEKLELNIAINKRLEEMAQALFKRWFVDFEFPNENGEPYKSSGGEFEESELGLIPKGWKIRSLDDIATLLNGLAMQKFRPEGSASIPVIKIKELNQGKTSSDSDKASPTIDAKYIVNNGDVLFSWSGTLEIKLWCGGIGGLNQHLFKVTSKEFDKWFYYFWTKNYIEKFRRIASDKATTMGHIKRSDLKESKVLIPDQNVYQFATAVLHPIVDKMIQLTTESFELEDIRDSLLPKLMTGEIRVSFEREYPLVQNFDLPMAAERKMQYSTT